MADKNIIPDYKERQKLLYVNDTPDEQLDATAQALIAEKRYSEAFDYLERMENEEPLKKFMAEAKLRGDLFNFARSARVLGIEVEPREWEELASMAIHAGLIMNAVESLRRAGNKARARELIAANPDFFGPVFEMERLAKPGVTTDLDDDEEEQKAVSAPEPEKVAPPPQVEAEASHEPKDPDQEAREAAARARKKKWKHKKK